MLNKVTATKATEAELTTGRSSKNYLLCNRAKTTEKCWAGVCSWVKTNTYI